MLELLTSGFVFVFDRKWQKTFVFVSVSVENEVSFSSLVSFADKNVKLICGQSVVTEKNFSACEQVTIAHISVMGTFHQLQFDLNLSLNH